MRLLGEIDHLELTSFDETSVLIHKSQNFERNLPLDFETGHTWFLKRLTMTAAMDYRYILVQEKQYILSMLAAEEARAEQYMGALHSTKARLDAAQTTHAVPEINESSLKRRVSGLNRKLRNSKRSQKIMIDSLNHIDHRLISEGRHRWQRLTFTNQQADDLTQVWLALHNQTIDRIPTFSQTPYPTQYSSSNPSSPYFLPISPSGDVRTLTNHSPWNSPIYSPVYEYSQPTPHHLARYYQSPIPAQSSDLQLEQSQWTQITGIPNPILFTPSSKPRAQSLPILRPTGSTSNSRRSSNSLEQIEQSRETEKEGNTDPAALGLGRPLSVAGGAAAGSRPRRLNSV